MSMYLSLASSESVRYASDCASGASHDVRGAVKQDVKKVRSSGNEGGLGSTGLLTGRKPRAGLGGRCDPRTCQRFRTGQG
jgi:hypothetical protein